MPKEKLETFDLKDKVIFSAGTHNGDLYTEEDLKKIEIAFNACKGKLRPPLKLGHGEWQGLWENEGLPAIGWVDNVRAVGNDLLADLVKIPRAIYELISVGAYRTMSAEIYWNAVVDGEKYPYALKALALLGADIPAVKTVSDLMALYKEDYVMSYAEESDCVVKIYEGTKAKEKKNMPENEQKIEAEVPPVDENKTEVTEQKSTPTVEDRVAELEKTVSTFAEKKAEYEKTITELNEKLSKKEVEFKEMEAKYSEAKEFMEKQAQEKRHSEMEKRVDSLVNGKKILPAEKASVMKLLSEMPLDKKYKDGEAEKTLEDLVFSVLESKTVALHTEEVSEAGGNNPIDDDTMIKKISKDKGLSYKEAYLVWKKTKAETR